MSDSKKFNEANENDLEQVAGGGARTMATYVCPVCGHTETEFYEQEIELNYPHYCLLCVWHENGRVEMIRQ